MRRASRILFSTVLVLSLSELIRAQGPSDSELRKSADEAYTAIDWTSSSRLYDSLTKSEPGNPRYWYRLGISAKSLGQYDKAVEALNSAEKAGTPIQIVSHARALVFASKGDTEGAFRALKVSVDNGFSDPDLLASEPEFAALHNDARFTAAVDQAKHNLAPCKFSSENRQFDFWIGEWSAVVTKDGTPAGDSRIELSLGDCVIVENWTSKNSGYAGKSYNVYNVGEKRWEQLGHDSILRQLEGRHHGFLHRG
jgi:tetratricopeptide (TPR) repeat protein